MNLDQKIFEHFKDKFNGIFIEIGAYDGIEQSNTFMLEERNKWTGILIEPSPNLKEKLKNNRKQSIIEMCAITDFNGTISGDFTGQMMSSINSNRNREFYLLNQQPLYMG